MSEKVNLLEVLREHAYGVIAWEKCLTILPTEHGAKVPGHWVNETDDLIASLLPEKVLRSELARRQGPI